MDDGSPHSFCCTLSHFHIDVEKSSSYTQQILVLHWQLEIGPSWRISDLQECHMYEAFSSMLLRTSGCKPVSCIVRRTSKASPPWPFCAYAPIITFQVMALRWSTISSNTWRASFMLPELAYVLMRQFRKPTIHPTWTDNMQSLEE